MSFTSPYSAFTITIYEASRWMELICASAGSGGIAKHFSEQPNLGRDWVLALRTEAASSLCFN